MTNFAFSINEECGMYKKGRFVESPILTQIDIDFLLSINIHSGSNIVVVVMTLPLVNSIDIN